MPYDLRTQGFFGLNIDGNNSKEVDEDELFSLIIEVANEVMDFQRSFIVCLPSPANTHVRYWTYARHFDHDPPFNSRFVASPETLALMDNRNGFFGSGFPDVASTPWPPCVVTPLKYEPDKSSTKESDRRSALYVPLYKKDKVFAYIVFLHNEVIRFQWREITIARALSAIASQAISGPDGLSHKVDLNDLLSIILESRVELFSHLSMHAIAKRFTKRVSWLLRNRSRREGYDKAIFRNSIRVFNVATRELHLIGTFDTDKEQEWALGEVKLLNVDEDTNDPSVIAFLSQKPLRNPAVEDLPKFTFEGTRYFLGTNISIPSGPKTEMTEVAVDSHVRHVSEEQLGLLAITSPGHEFGEDDENLLFLFASFLASPLRAALEREKLDSIAGHFETLDRFDKTRPTSTLTKPSAIEALDRSVTRLVDWLQGSGSRYTDVSFWLFEATKESFSNYANPEECISHPTLVQSLRQGKSCYIREDGSTDRKVKKDAETYSLIPLIVTNNDTTETYALVRLKRIDGQPLLPFEIEPIRSFIDALARKINNDEALLIRKELLDLSTKMQGATDYEKAYAILLDAFKNTLGFSHIRRYSLLPGNEALFLEHDERPKNEKRPNLRIIQRRHHDDCFKCMEDSRRKPILQRYINKEDLKCPPEVKEEGWMLVMDNPDTLRDALGKGELDEWLDLPLFAGDEILGKITVHYLPGVKRRITHTDYANVTVLSRILSQALERIRLLGEVKRTRRTAGMLAHYFVAPARSIEDAFEKFLLQEKQLGNSKAASDLKARLRQLGERIDAARRSLELAEGDFPAGRISLSRHVREYFQEFASLHNEIAVNLEGLATDDLHCYCNTGHLYGALDLITGNTLEHSEASKVDVSLFEQSGDKGGRVLRLCVKDNGKGFQIDATSVELSSVTWSSYDAKPRAGFGNYLLRSILELYKATVNITSAPGKGTVISIDFPVVQD